MIAPSGVSNGEEGPKSSTKPVFLDELCQVTVVPVFTQNDAFPLAFGMFGVADAELLPLRFTSTLHALVVDPQVVLALHMLPGFDPEQTYLSPLLLFISRADRYPAAPVTANTSKLHHIATLRCVFMRHLNAKRQIAKLSR
jgi:hypothetical protein